MVIKIIELNIHKDLKDVMPELNDIEYKQLEKSILEKGYLSSNPIIVWRGYIVDGHARYSICKRNKIDFSYVELSEDMFDDIMGVVKYIIDIHICRRNLNIAQKISIAYKYRDYIVEWNKERQRKGSDGCKSRENYTDAQLAKIAGVGTGTIARYEIVRKSGDTDIFNKMMSGEVSVYKAYKKVTTRKPISRKIQKIKMQETNGNCEICGCCTSAILEFHHIKMVSEGGNNNYDNIKLICPNCHSLLHILNDTNDINAKKALLQSLKNTQYQKLVEIF